MAEPTPEVIEENDLFAGIPLSVLAEFLEEGEEEKYPEQSIIVEEDSEHDGFYYIIDGEVSIVKNGDTYVDVLGQGECFGEMSLFGPGEASASVVSNGIVDVYYFPRDLVNQFIEDDHEFAVTFFKNVLSRMSYRLRKTTDALTNMRNKAEALLNKEYDEIFNSLDMDMV